MSWPLTACTTYSCRSTNGWDRSDGPSGLTTSRYYCRECRTDRELSISSNVQHVRTIVESFEQQRIVYFIQYISFTHCCRECLPQIEISLFHAVYSMYALLQRVSTTDRDFSISCSTYHLHTVVESVYHRQRLLYFIPCIACTHNCGQCQTQILDRDFSISSSVQPVCTVAECLLHLCYYIQRGTSPFHIICIMHGKITTF